MARVKSQLRRYVHFGTYEGAQKNIVIDGLALMKRQKKLRLMAPG